MPLARYFLCVGGVLLALLFMVSAELPKVPATQATNTVAELPMIRIHTDRKWPERVVFDTSIPAATEPVAPELTQYLNRLSDLLFVLARVIVRHERGSEVLWRHERSRKS